MERFDNSKLIERQEKITAELEELYEEEHLLHKQWHIELGFFLEEHYDKYLLIADRYYVKLDDFSTFLMRKPKSNLSTFKVFGIVIDTTTDVLKHGLKSCLYLGIENSVVEVSRDDFLEALSKASKVILADTEDNFKLQSQMGYPEKSIELVRNYSGFFNDEARRFVDKLEDYFVYGDDE